MTDGRKRAKLEPETEKEEDFEKFKNSILVGIFV